MPRVVRLSSNNGAHADLGKSETGGRAIDVWLLPSVAFPQPSDMPDQMIMLKPTLVNLPSFSSEVSQVPFFLPVADEGTVMSWSATDLVVCCFNHLDFRFLPALLKSN